MAVDKGDIGERTVGIPPAKPDRAKAFMDALSQPLPEPSQPPSTPATKPATPDEPLRPKYMPSRTPAEMDQFLASGAVREAIERAGKRTTTPFADRRRLAQEPPEKVLVRVPLKTIRAGTPNEQVAPAPTKTKPGEITPEKFAKATRSASSAIEELRQRKGLKQ